MLPQLWVLTRRWAWLCVLGSLLAGAAAYAVSLQLPKVYEGRARLLLTPSQSGTVTDYNVVLAGERLTRTYAEIAKSRPLVETAIQAGGLGLSFELVLPMLDVAPVLNTQLIQITARADTPQLAAALPNLVGAALIQRTEASQSSRFASNREALAKQLLQVSTDIAQHATQMDALRNQPQGAERDAQLARLQLEQADLAQVYADVTRNFADLRRSEAASLDLLSVIEPATISTQAVQPRVLVNVIVSAIVGFALAGALAVLVDSARAGRPSVQSPRGAPHAPFTSSPKGVRRSGPARMARQAGVHPIPADPHRQQTPPAALEQLGNPKLSPLSHDTGSRPA